MSKLRTLPHNGHMKRMGELSGMTVNERLFERGLVAEWDAAFSSRDREAMIKILGQVELADQADWIADSKLGRNP